MNLTNLSFIVASTNYCQQLDIPNTHNQTERIMKVKYKKQEMPTKLPCLMENQFGTVCLITKGQCGNIHCTRLSDNGNNLLAEGMITFETDLSGYKPLPKGTKIVITN